MHLINGIFTPILGRRTLRCIRPPDGADNVTDKPRRTIFPMTANHRFPSSGHYRQEVVYYTVLYLVRSRTDLSQSIFSLRVGRVVQRIKANTYLVLSSVIQRNKTND